jgi:hypothetical protein
MADSFLAEAWSPEVMSVPVVLFVFNRPETTARVLAALKGQSARPREVLVFADGPRHAEDAPKVEEVRNLVRAVDWAEVRLTARERNLGCAPNIIGGLTEVFTRRPEAIVIEDDTLPAAHFCEAMQRMLAHYRSSTDVFAVGGYPSLRADALPDYPYDVVLSPRFSCWGWATWAGRWKRVSDALPSFANPFGAPESVPLTAGADMPAMARAVAARPGFYWDIPVSLLCLRHGWLQAITRHYLVTNIGTASGTHGATDLNTSYLNRHNVVRDERPERMAPPAPDARVAAAVQRYVEESIGALRRTPARPTPLRRIRQTGGRLWRQFKAR